MRVYRIDEEWLSAVAVAAEQSIVISSIFIGKYAKMAPGKDFGI